MSNEQFGRYANLIVANQQTGLDLSQLHFKFRTTNNDADAPNTIEVRVYNLSDRTSHQTIEEFDTVTLDVGYENNHAIIFRGTIKQFRRGKENNVDSYLDILAADNDLGYNFGVINQTFGAGTTSQQEAKAYADAMDATLDQSADEFLSATGGVILNPRGKVAFGLARSYMRDLATTFNARWSIQNGILYLIPLSGYLSGEAVKINSLTGMIGIPEATSNGISVRTLLNPQIRIGGAIEINNKDITQTEIRDRFFPGYRTATFVANTSNDGLYRVLVAEYAGDTRDQTWYTEIIGLAIDPSASPNQSVQPFG
jgi:hypothetical protein